MKKLFIEGNLIFDHTELIVESSVKKYLQEIKYLNIPKTGIP